VLSHSYEALDSSHIIPISAKEKINLHYISAYLEKIFEEQKRRSSKIERRLSARRASPLLQTSTAIGIVMNTWKSRNDGVSIHMVLR